MSLTSKYVLKFLKIYISHSTRFQTDSCPHASMLYK